MDSGGAAAPDGAGPTADGTLADGERRGPGHDRAGPGGAARCLTARRDLTA
ncbi:MAG: hypothetical protein R2699_10115 [Acidimicrobiales bacterium]